MVISNVLLRVMRIVHGSSCGTAFTVEHNNEQFIVTAKHLFRKEGFPLSSTISLLIGKDYKVFDVDVKYPAEQTVDIAVLKHKDKKYLTPAYDVVYSMTGVAMGQDVFFIGFPYDYDNILKLFPGENMPVPFIKKACMSAVLNDAAGTIILDGINNPGFSGSPVCYNDVFSKNTMMKILGVVSGYRNDIQPLYDQFGNQLNYYAKGNSGLIIVGDIKHAISIIENWSN